MAGGARRKTKTPLWLVCLYVGAMLATGTINTLTTKIQFTLKSVGIDGETETFQKPWFGTFNMLFAMSLVLVCQRLAVGCARICFPAPPKAMAEAALLEGASAEGQSSRRRKILLVAIPAVSDLLATAFACIGIMYIPASVWQMLRGATLIFAAIFSIMFLGRKMYGFNWLGLLLCVIGISVVGIASINGSNDDASSVQDSSSVMFGMGLTLLGQVVQAAQVIAEEYLMKDVDLPAVEIVGYEGLWGLLILIVIVYPLLWILPGPDHGHAEDIVDTLVLLSNSKEIMSVVVLYIFSCGTFNMAGIAVTGALSGVHRMMLDASRTMVIWAFGLFVHYRINPSSAFGEAWNSSSYLQLVGFFVLVMGQAIYGEIIKVPGLTYPSQEEEDYAHFASPSAALHMASPLPREA
eukprot:gb/GFBE01028477.1/.p1 GENE.gb/GFBE01028477.1/~~gb/GFBE01028477.1/.p1  ORF type:complete len:408 (+),score=79.62 gb/GFBE01028477.1/:1-1224(+)